MSNFLRENKTKILIIVGLLIFTITSGVFAVYYNTKDITVKINNRSTPIEAPEYVTIYEVNLNKSLREVLDENNLPTNEDYIYDVDLDTKVADIDQDDITGNRVVSGTINVDGRSMEFSTGAETVRELIEESDIDLAPSDTTDPGLDTALNLETTTINVLRKTQERQDREEAIPYETEQNYDSNLPAGTVEIDVPGIEGRKIVTEDVYYENGKPTHRDKISEETLIEPVTEVIRIGNGDFTSSYNSASYGYNGTPLILDDFDLVCAIVEHEGGSSYEGALAVMSCVMNRVESPDYPDDPVSVLTAPGQFASYLDGYYQQFLGNSSTAVRQAVTDALGGKRSHSYLNFRSYKTDGSVNIGGNWYF